MGAEGVRRSLGLLLCALLAACTAVPGAAAPTAEPSVPPAWRTATPEAEGFESSALAEALLSFRDRDLPLHAVVLVRDAAVVLDAAFYPYDGTTPHQVGAITKTVLATLLGIAVDRGLVALDDPVVSYFPERAIANRDARKERLTVRHLAAMTSGLDCTSADDEATLRRMTESPDPVGFTLDLPVTAEPGSTFRYCSPGSHLLGAVLERAAGVSLLEFARQFLFEPLGIADVRWAADPQGHQHGWSDLYLVPRDLAKLGTLWAAGGIWDGKQIMSAAWVATATEVQADTGAAADHGFGWLVPHEGSDADDAGIVAAAGHGGQMLRIDRARGIVLVTAGCGVEPGRVADPLLRALTSPDRPLLGDPEAVARLARATESVASGPAAFAAPGPAGTIRRIAGVTWQLEPNPLGIQRLRLDLQATQAEGAITLAVASAPGEVAGPVGLDGRYRVAFDGRRHPLALRGTWEGGKTFVLDVDACADGLAYTLRLRFAMDARRVTVEGRERGDDAGFVVEGSRAD